MDFIISPFFRILQVTVSLQHVSLVFLTLSIDVNLFYTVARQFLTFYWDQDTCVLEANE